jgi:hypothetical protein
MKPRTNECQTWRQFYRDRSQTHVVDNISIAKLWKRFPFFFFKVKPLAVTFQTANGQAIAQRDEIDESGPAIRPINRSQTGRKSIVFHLLGLLLSVCRVPNDPESKANKTTWTQKSMISMTVRCPRRAAVQRPADAMRTGTNGDGRVERRQGRELVKQNHPAEPSSESAETR